MARYCILGSDDRTMYLRKILKDEKKDIVSLEKADVVITPIPFTKDKVRIFGESIKIEDLIENLSKGKILISGAIPKEIKVKLESRSIAYFDIMENDSMAINNAIPTAEGAINIAIENTDFTLQGSNVLILGFGKIGKVLAKMLHGIGANVYCEARKESDISLINAMGLNSVHLSELNDVIPNMNVIFNTIPSLILDKQKLKLVDKNSLIVDLASAPGGVDFNFAKEQDIAVKWALALPSKVAPFTAAKYIKKEIDKII